MLRHLRHLRAVAGVEVQNQIWGSENETLHIVLDSDHIAEMGSPGFDTNLFRPHPGASLPPPRLPLTAEQQAQYNELEAHFGKSDFGLPVQQDSEKKSELSEREMMYLVRERIMEPYD